MTIRAVRVRGPFLGPSGYDHHVREFVRELHRQGVAVQLIDVPEWGPARLPPDRRDPWFETLGADVGARVALHFTTPHLVAPYPSMANVNHTMFEATHIHPAWVAQADRCDLIALPTESSRRAWIDSGVPADKLRLCPLGIDPAAFATRPEPLPLRTADGEPVDRYRVRFLNVSELGPRKNQPGLLRAWLRATTPADDAILIVKLGLYAPGWEDEWRARVAQVQDEAGRRLDEAAPVLFISALLSDREMPRLFAAATHYVSMSFGEGWDQPMVEAAATGLRLIAPDHSAYRAYLDPSTATLLPSRPVPARFPGGGATGRLFVGAHWWQPDPDSAVAAIRAAIAGRDTPRASARERILRDFTWEKATRRLIEVLAEMDRSPGRGPFRLPWRRRG